MADFGKAYCNLHPHEVITNFCCKQQCLVGLCTNCICTHTQSHVEKGTSPNYENIKTTCKKMHECIQNQMQEFDEDKERIMSISQKVQEKRDKVNELVDMAKSETLIKIQALFEERRSKMLREIEAQQKQAGLHCQKRLESLISSISRQTTALIYASDDLNSANFIESLPRIRTQILVNAQNFHRQVRHEIQQNENFKTSITYHENTLNVLTGYVNNIISMGFTLNGSYSFLKAQNNPLKTSRTVSKGKDDLKMSLNKNPSIALGLLQNGIPKRNAQSQVNIANQNYMNEISSKKIWNNTQDRSSPNIYAHPNPHNTIQNFSYQPQPQPQVYHYQRPQPQFQPNQVQNVYSVAPQKSEYTNPLGPSNSQQKIISGSRVGQQKFSVSKNNRQSQKLSGNTQYSPQQTFYGMQKTSIVKKTKKSGLRVSQNLTEPSNENEVSYETRGNY